MNVVIKRLPGFRNPPEYRLMFVDAPGGRPAYEHHIQGNQDLVQFLRETLTEPVHVVSRVVGELESSYGAPTSIGSLRADSGALAALLRMQEKQGRQAGARVK